MAFPHLQNSIDRLLSEVKPSIGRILDAALSDNDISIAQATELFDTDGSDLLALTAAADYMRAKTVGDVSPT